MVSLNKNLIRESIKHYGEEMQLNVAIEEMSELTKEICKHKRGASNRKAVVEEMADVLIMFGNLRIIFEVNDSELDMVIIKKQERLVERMKAERRESIYGKGI